MTTKTILHIEDNEILVRLISRVVEKNLDYKYIFTTDGPEGYETAVEIIPDLIIMDIYLPTENGVVWAKKLKLNPETKHIPIIALTAGTATLSRWDMPSGTFEMFLRKPIANDDLIRKIGQVLKYK